jgi:hypothetical protein
VQPAQQLSFALKFVSIWESFVCAACSDCYRQRLLNLQYTIYSIRILVYRL